MKHAVFSFALILALVFSVALWGKEFRFSNNSSAAPAATGKVDIDHDRNGNAQLKVQVYHLADPEKLTPAKSAYVVWVQPAGKPPENVGQLKVNENLEGTLTATSPYKKFDVFITAEDNAHADTPSGPEVLRTTVNE